MITALQYALWPAYWWLQGVVCTGLWVIAHECGHQVRLLVCFCAHATCHAGTARCRGWQPVLCAAWLQAFSRSQAINDGIGLVVHSCLLVPYYSWCVVDALAKSVSVKLMPHSTCGHLLLTTLRDSTQETLAQATSQQHRQRYEG